MISNGYFCCILNVEQFNHVLSRIKEVDNDLMCELYLHLFPNRIDWDPNFHVGDLQVRDYISFLANQIK